MSLQRPQGTGPGFRSAARVEHLYIEPEQTFVLHGQQAIASHSPTFRHTSPSVSHNTATPSSGLTTTARTITQHAAVRAHESDNPRRSTVCFFRAYAQVPTATQLEANLRPSQSSGHLWYVVTRGWRVGIFPSWDIAQHMVSFVFGPVYRECSSLEDALYWYRLSAAESPGPTVVPRCPGAPPCPLLLHCPPESFEGDFLLADTDTNWTFPAAYPATPLQPPPGYEDRDQGLAVVGNQQTQPTPNSSQGSARYQEEEPASPTEPRETYNISDLASSDEDEYGSILHLTEEDRNILDRIERESSSLSETSNN